MCGICGEVQFRNGQGVAQPIALGGVESMSSRLVPRGPDAGGFYSQPGAVLGHRRLSIIDLTTDAQQPMVDSTLGSVLVYNGAIYNYPALRTELEGLGYQFFSHGDSEVILKAYDAWGPTCVERFNGMFAFVIWHRRTGEVFMARDRLGIKPLYFADLPSGVRFASSLPALLAGGGIDTTIDPVALHTYMHFHAVVPAPYTILAGVRKLPAATYVRIAPDGTRHSHTYWSLSYERDEVDAMRCEADWQDLVQEKLTDAVRRRTVADVPVGVLLSGGVDSSIVVGLLAQDHDAIPTFSIGFEASGGEAGDEFKYSDHIAKHFRTDHHKFFFGHQDIVDSLAGCVGAMSEPMVSHDCVAFYLLSRAVKEHVKVVQSGQGADEIFAGYHWYPKLHHSTNALADYASSFFDRDHADFAEAVHDRFVQDDHSRAFVADHFARMTATNAVDKAMHLDTTVMLVDDPVKRLDNMSMAWGLEARVPFLDHELVETAAKVPPALKLAQEGKGILKSIARRIIPDAVIDRPKGYFPVPVLKHMEGPSLDFARDILTGRRARDRSLFKPGYVDRLLANPAAHITPLRGSKLWQLTVLEYWLQEHQL